MAELSRKHCLWCEEDLPQGCKYFCSAECRTDAWESEKLSCFEALFPEPHAPYNAGLEIEDGYDRVRSAYAGRIEY
ncbi:MAG: hypothetical protein ACXABY_07760 [Candidatus Thorarchaeota archaeon]|jgi:hypothetical protein